MMDVLYTVFQVGTDRFVEKHIISIENQPCTFRENELGYVVNVEQK